MLNTAFKRCHSLSSALQRARHEDTSPRRKTVSQKLLVAHFFSCIYATVHCNRSFCCSSPSKVCVCDCKPDEVKGGSLLGILFFSPFIFLHVQTRVSIMMNPDCPLSASVMNRCMNLKEPQAEGGKLYKQGFFVNYTHTHTHAILCFNRPHLHSNQYKMSSNTG